MILKAEHQSKLVAQKSGRQTTRSSHCGKSRRVKGTDAVILGPRKASFVECAVHYFMKFMQKYRVEIYSAGGWAAGTPISFVGYTQDGTHGSPLFIGRVLMGSGGGWRRTPEPTNQQCVFSSRFPMRFYAGVGFRKVPNAFPPPPPRALGEATVSTQVLSHLTATESRPRGEDTARTYQLALEISLMCAAVQRLGRSPSGGIQVPPLEATDRGELTI